MRFLLFFCFVPALAQMTLPNQANVRPGATVQIPVSLNAPPPNVAGVQWSIGVPANYSATVTAGAAAAAAGKQLACSTDNRTCLVVGMNTNAIGAGVLATYSVIVPPGTPKGVVTIPLTGVLAGASDGSEVALDAGPAFTLRILARHDINADGVTDAVDLQAMVDQVTGKAACADDQNGDGKCNLLDALLVILGSIVP